MRDDAVRTGAKSPGGLDASQHVRPVLLLHDRLPSADDEGVDGEGGALASAARQDPRAGRVGFYPQVRFVELQELDPGRAPEKVHRRVADGHALDAQEVEREFRAVVTDQHVGELHSLEGIARDALEAQGEGRAAEQGARHHARRGAGEEIRMDEEEKEGDERDDDTREEPERRGEPRFQQPLDHAPLLRRSVRG